MRLKSGQNYNYDYEVTRYRPCSEKPASKSDPQRRSPLTVGDIITYHHSNLDLSAILKSYRPIRKVAKRVKSRLA